MGELTHAEGKQLLQKLGTKFTDKEQNFIFTNIGTRAAMLVRLASIVPGVCTLEQFVDEELAEALDDLYSFPHKAILEELIPVLEA